MQEPFVFVSRRVDRRQFLSHSGCVAAAGLSGCDRKILSGGSTEPMELLDAHCHLFNLADLPATHFITQVLLKRYPEPREARLMKIEDRDWLEKLVRWVVENVVRKVPGAASETKLLSGTAPLASGDTEPSALSEASSQDFVAERIAKRLQARSFTDDPTEQRIDQAILAAAGRRPNTASLQLDAQAVARQAIASQTDLGTFFRWVATLRLYRHKITEKLAADYRAQAITPRILAPALVDFSNWIDEQVRPDSDLPEQVEVMGWVSRRSSMPVHGYVAFDPLREIYFRRQWAQWSPLALVEAALTRHGFLGVKLYPPMGFRPLGNKGSNDPYPPQVKARLGESAGEQLDQALNSLYAKCVGLNAPIIAHGAESHAAGENYGKRADPTYWLPVLRSYPSLRVCVAHFGSFADVAAGRPQPAKGKKPPFEDTWEFVVGGFVKTNPIANLFADISYLSDIFGRSDRRRAAQSIRRYIRDFDQAARHLVYGSDWIMLGVQSKYPGYARQVHDFLRLDCGMTDAQLHNVFVANPRRFLGLEPGHPTLARLLEFYRANGLDPAKLGI